MKIKRASAVWTSIVLAVAVIPESHGQNELDNPDAIASAYVVDLVATAAFGSAINDAGDVVGTSYPDPGCGSSCLPPLETVAWKNGVRIVLPSVPGLSGATVNDINNQGWICGFGGPFGFGHAAAWKPNGNGYTAIDMGLLPGTTSSNAIGLDDTNRAVGYATASSGFETPFVWTEAGGIANLVTQGFPNERPLGISPGGTVATVAHWYHLGDPGSLMTLPTAPSGFLLENSTVAINDAGDQARFLVTTGTENLDYPFRFHHEGTYQQISFIPTGHLSSAGVGSINDVQDVTATVQGAAMIAAGPNGLLQSLAALVSPAYRRERSYGRRADECERANSRPYDHRPIGPATGEIGPGSALHQQLHPGDERQNEGKRPGFLRPGIRPGPGFAHGEERSGGSACGRDGHRAFLRRLLARSNRGWDDELPWPGEIQACWPAVRRRDRVFGHECDQHASPDLRSHHWNPDELRHSDALIPGSSLGESGSSRRESWSSGRGTWAGF